MRMKETALTRRAVLGALGAASAGTVVGNSVLTEVTTSGFEPTRRTRLGRRLTRDTATRRAVVTRHAGELMTRLPIDGDGAAAFDYDTFDSRRGRIEDRSSFEGTAVTTVPVDGTPTTLVIASAWEGDTHVRLFVQPERDTSYAFVSSPEETRLLYEEATAGISSEVTTSGTCTGGADCQDTQCSSCIDGTVYYERVLTECTTCIVDGREECCCAITGEDCGCTFSCDGSGGDETPTEA